MRAVLLSAIASMGLVGCVGQLDTGTMPDDNDVGSGSGTNPNPNPDGVARKMYEDNVYPILSATTGASSCAAAGCHMIGNTPASTQFVAQTKAEGWATITSFTSVVGAFTPSTAAILTKIDQTGGHQGKTYTTDERKKITDWLAQEVLDRAGGGGGGSGSGGESPGAASARVMNSWSSCLSLADFDTANMTQAWQGMQAEGNACNTCHNTGYANTIITVTKETIANGPPGMFTTIGTIKEFMIMWFIPDLTQTGPDGKKGKIVINNQAFIGVSARQAPHATHPAFNWNNSNGKQALQAWYDLTMAKLTAAGATGNCGTTKLDPPAT